MAILRVGFTDYQHFLGGKTGVWVTDLPFHMGITGLICPLFPDDVFVRFEHEWAHAWRKAFIPSTILNRFDWSMYEQGIPEQFQSSIPPNVDL